VNQALAGPPFQATRQYGRMSRSTGEGSTNPETVLADDHVDAPSCRRGRGSRFIFMSRPATSMSRNDPNGAVSRWRWARRSVCTERTADKRSRSCVLWSLLGDALEMFPRQLATVDVAAGTGSHSARALARVEVLGREGREAALVDAATTAGRALATDETPVASLRGRSAASRCGVGGGAMLQSVYLISAL
jgi:hypothetical protein